MRTVARAYRRTGDLRTSFEHNFSLCNVSRYIIWSISKADNSRCHREIRNTFTFGKGTFCGDSQLIQPYFVLFVCCLHNVIILVCTDTLCKALFPLFLVICVSYLCDGEFVSNSNNNECGDGRVELYSDCIFNYNTWSHRQTVTIFE